MQRKARNGTVYMDVGFATKRRQRSQVGVSRTQVRLSKWHELPTQGRGVGQQTKNIKTMAVAAAVASQFQCELTRYCLGWLPRKTAGSIYMLYGAVSPTYPLHNSKTHGSKMKWHLSLSYIVSFCLFLQELELLSHVMSTWAATQAHTYQLRQVDPPRHAGSSVGVRSWVRR